MHLVLERSRTGLSASNSSTTYAPVVSSEKVTINPSSPSVSVVSIRINSAIGGVYHQPPRQSAQFCSVGSADSGVGYTQNGLSGMEMHRLLPDVGAEASMRRNRGIVNAAKHRCRRRCVQGKRELRRAGLRDPQDSDRHPAHLLQTNSYES